MYPKPISIVAKGTMRNFHFQNAQRIQNKRFIKIAKDIVANYTAEHLDKTDSVANFDVYVVWNAYILGNIKAL